MIFLILLKTAQHLFLVIFSVLLAALCAVPVGLFLTRIRTRRWANLVLRFSALIQTIPGIAMLALIVALLASLHPEIPVPTTGMFPAILALSFYAIFPMMTNTYAGIKQVNPALIEVAQGIGMSSKQILMIVEVPLALPFILSGMRIACIWTIGMATLTSLIGSGGLGDLVMQGLRSLNPSLVLAGTIPAALLAIGCEIGLSRLELWFTKHHAKNS